MRVKITKGAEAFWLAGDPELTEFESPQPEDEVFVPQFAMDWFDGPGLSRAIPVARENFGFTLSFTARRFFRHGWERADWITELKNGTLHPWTGTLTLRVDTLAGGYVDYEAEEVVINLTGEITQSWQPGGGHGVAVGYRIDGGFVGDAPVLVGPDVPDLVDVIDEYDEYAPA